MLLQLVATALLNSQAMQVTLHPSYEVLNKTDVVYAQGLTGCKGEPGTCAGGVAKNLTLSIYYPATTASNTASASAKKAPAIILSHGGGNTGGNNSQYCFIGTALYFASRGFVAYDINYRLAGDNGMLPAGDAPGPNPTPPGPSPPAPIAPGTPVVSHARTAAGRGCLAFYPHPNRSSSSSSSSAPASTSDAYTGLFSTGPNGTGSCLTAGPSNASALEVDTTAAAPAAFSGPLALSFGLCVTGNPAQQFKRADQGAIKAELLQHVASGQCVTVDAASRNVVLAPCASSDSWVLGSSGVLFVADSKHPKNSGTCATSPAARSLALASDAEYYGSHADDGADDGRDEGGDERGGGEGEHVLGWKPKWGSGYPAVRDLKAAIRYVRATSATYNVDPTRVVVTGGSAGATNSLAAGVVFEADYKDELNTTQDSTLLSTNLEQSSSVQVVYTHWSSHGEVDLVAAYDPNHVDRWSSKNAPVIEFHGDKDTTIPIQQAYDVQAIYNKTGVPYSMNVLKNASHGAWCYGCPSGAGNPSCGVSLYCDWMDSIAFPFITTHLNLAVE